MNRSEFIYELADNKIAKQPVAPRHNSKLLQYKNGEISSHNFYDLPDLLPQSCQLIINNAKVIPARIFCQKPTGAGIEVFLLEPIGDYLSTFANTHSVVWKVLVGNKKRWKEGSIVDIGKLCTMNWVNRDENIVSISWNNAAIFAELLEKMGKIPIPPYLNRESKDQDKSDYQTFYSKIKGSVAAPTAGLHFTEKVLKDLDRRGVNIAEATLHVGAGTFKPVEADMIADHSMHAERFELSLKFIEKLLNHQGIRVAVGTTSLRVLESIYQIGINLSNKINNPQHVMQHHTHDNRLSYKESLVLVKNYLLKHGDQTASTSIFLYPSKNIKSIDALITNFHQPSSSLIMLIAACIGNDWKKVYGYALNNDYRFLSYGDSSLLWL